jgi:hypothetical protein
LSPVQEGIFTGLLGAGVVAIFYFALDLSHGLPLLTPSVLGQTYILREPPTATLVNPAAVLAYTAVHLAAFFGFGVLLAYLVRAAERTSLARYAVVQLFIVFELLFYGVLQVGSETTRGMFTLWGVLAANSLAVLAMGVWQWRHHPMLRLASRATPLGATNPAGD